MELGRSGNAAMRSGAAVIIHRRACHSRLGGGAEGSTRTTPEPRQEQCGWQAGSGELSPLSPSKKTSFFFQLNDSVRVYSVVSKHN